LKNQNYSDRVYLGIGSNLGSRKENIIRGFNLLSEFIEDIETSSLYETEPMYMTDQPKFLNTVFRGMCSFSPEILLKKIHIIESELGRNRIKSGYKGPRPLDIDIILFGNRIIDTSELKIPHPGIKERLFVLKPLLEFSSTLTDPETGVKYSDIIESLKEEGIYYFESCRYIENQTKRGK
jgi:2-amino-4-hydroxy-6-hydroxymethyldihydropteridine diphosphokinase